jgi:hypothetical protein
MILKATGSYSAHYSVHDSSGNRIPFVVSFDTETSEVELMIQTSKGSVVTTCDSLGHPTPLQVKTVISGAYLTRNGKQITNLEEDILLLQEEMGNKNENQNRSRLLGL